MKNLVKILLICLGLVGVGIGSIVGGWVLHRQSLHGGDVPNFSQWLVDAVGRVGPLLVDSDSDLGQRLGSAGIILAATGITSGLAILGIEYNAQNERRSRKGTGRQFLIALAGVVVAMILAVAVIVTLAVLR